RGSVNSVSKKNDRLAPLKLPELLVKSIIYGFVKTGAIADLCFLDRTSQLCPVACWRAKYVNPLVECDDLNFVSRSKLVDKGDRCILDILDLPLRRRTDVKQHNNSERAFNRSKILNLLLNIVLEDLEILLLQARNKTPIPIKNRNRHCYQIGFDLDDFVLFGICGRRW